MGHEFADREVVSHDDGTRVLVAFCSCGWSVKVGPFVSLVRAELALEAAMARHAYPSAGQPDVGHGASDVL